MSILALLVFLLSTKAEEKIQLSINILFALTFFYLLIFETLPPTSLVVPIIVKNLILTMTFNVICTVLIIFVINIHFRRPELHKNMPNLVRKIFLEFLPKYIFFTRINNHKSNELSQKKIENYQIKTLDKMRRLRNLETYHYRKKWLMRRYHTYSCKINELAKSSIKLTPIMSFNSNQDIISKNYDNVYLCKRKLTQKMSNFENLILNKMKTINEMSSYFENYDKSKKVRLEWQQLAYVLDRIFLIIMSVLFIISITLVITYQTPFLNYDDYVKQKTNICN